MLERHYVLAVRGNETVMIGDSFASRTAVSVALDGADWHRLPAGQGSKGPRRLSPRTHAHGTPAASAASTIAVPIFGLVLNVTEGGTQALARREGLS